MDIPFMYVVFVFSNVAESLSLKHVDVQCNLLMKWDFQIELYFVDSANERKCDSASLVMMTRVCFQVVHRQFIPYT